MELIKKEYELQTENKINAKKIIALCRSITPKFYENKKIEDIALELKGIELMISNLPYKTLQKACEIAVKYYPIERTENQNLYFDINYILRWYKCADWMVRNGIEKEEYLFDDIDKVNL